MSNRLLQEAEKYVRSVLNTQLSDNFLYHSIEHTEEIVAACVRLAEQENISEKGTALLKIAAWFHDIGYAISLDNHEEESAQLADAFLLAQEVKQEEITAIKSLILATKYPTSPNSLLEKIICDADTFSLGTEQYLAKSKLIRKEWERVYGSVYTDLEWWTMSVDFLKNHQYYTAFGKSELEPTKQTNLNLILDKLK